MKQSIPSTRRRLCTRAALLLLCLSLAGCATAPSPPPTVVRATSVPGDIVTQPYPRYSANLQVAAYCICGGPRGQLAIKVKVEVINSSAGTLDASLDQFRLVATAVDGSKWSPAPGGNGAPQSINTSDGQMWFFPPNPDNIVEPIDAHTVTWKTHWDATIIPAGGSYVKPGPREGDIVFYIPTPPGGQLPFLAIALVGNDKSRVMGFTEFTDWGPLSDPHDF